MITVLLSVSLFFIFLVLSGFHFYWLCGGVWGLEKVIPTKENEASPLLIPKFATLVVALGLVLLGVVYLMKSGLVNAKTPEWFTSYAYWMIPSVFLARAIGEFKYVGIFKKVKNTEFAKADSKIFVPLCLIIGLLGILVQLMANN